MPLEMENQLSCLEAKDLLKQPKDKRTGAFKAECGRFEAVIGALHSLIFRIKCLILS